MLAQLYLFKNKPDVEFYDFFNRYSGCSIWSIIELFRGKHFKHIFLETEPMFKCVLCFFFVLLMNKPPFLKSTMNSMTRQTAVSACLLTKPWVTFTAVLLKRFPSGGLSLLGRKGLYVQRDDRSSYFRQPCWKIRSF